MRAQRKKDLSGFSLVELMIVVAIIGVLAALAVYGVRRYLASAKTSEAKNNVGAISRGASSAYEREYTWGGSVAEGDVESKPMHALCDTAVLVPFFVPAGNKYQPKTGSWGADFNTGSTIGGWNCLKFQLTQPHYYQYLYTKNGMMTAPLNPAPCVSDCYEAGAIGDLDGDSVYSRFARTGQINTSTGQLKAATQVYIEAEFE